MLTDGCLIDLCGVTLMWRSAMGLDQGLVRDKYRCSHVTVNVHYILSTSYIYYFNCQLLLCINTC